MNQGQAIQVVNELLPEIGRTKDPEGTLLKYATDNNLSPAQLERLGQVFNTAKTISYMEKSASRGGSFSLVDISKLVGQYMGLDNVAPELSKCASSNTPACRAKDPYKIPNLWKEDPGVIKKASPIKPNETSTWFRMTKLAKEVRSYQEGELEYFENLLDLHDSTLRNIHEGIEKLAFHILERGGNTYADLQRDSLASLSRNENALGHVSDYLDKVRPGSYKKADITKLSSVKVVKDTTGLLDQLNALEIDLQVYDETRGIMLKKLAAGWKSPEEAARALEALKTQLPPGEEEAPVEGEDELEVPSPDSFKLISTPAGPDNPSIQEMLEQSYLEGSGAQDEADADVMKNIQSPSFTVDSGDAAAATSSTKANIRGMKGFKFPDGVLGENTGDGEDDEGRAFYSALRSSGGDSSAMGAHRDELVRRMRAAVQAGKEQKERDKDKPVLSDTILKKFDEGHKALNDNVVKPKFEKAIDWLKGHVTSKPSSDKGRAMRDNVQTDVRRATILQKALSNDAVLASADPARVVSLYNTLYKANPEMMSDENTMLSALREAVQYDGVMPHTYDQFVTTAKNRAQQTKDEISNREQRYKIN